jgi:hypothetical protein
MDNKTLNGYLAEISVIKALVKEGWDIFTPTSGKTTHDLLVYHSDIGILSIQVKSTIQKAPSGSYIVTLKSTRSNTKSNTIYKFNNKLQDILAVYIVDIDKVIFYLSEELECTSAMTIPLKDIDTLSSISLLDLLVE